MARFLYFLPIEPPSSVDGLPEGHVKKVLSGAECIFRGTTSGPSGEGGCVVMAVDEDDDGTVPGFYPDKQEWKQYPWGAIGWERDKKPGPDDLLKADAVGGDLVKLGDKEEWLLPLLGPAWQELPGIIKDRPEGGCEIVLRDEYRPLCQESEWWFDTFRQQRGYMFDRFLSFVSDALACNYRVGRPEVGELSLLSTTITDQLQILVVLLGLKRANEESKKKSEAGGPSEPDGG